MAQISIVREAIFGTFRDWRLWLVQLIVNPILFAVFVGWLLLPVSNGWFVFLNFLVIATFVAGVVALHGSTLNYQYGQGRGESVLIRASILRALRNSAAILVCALVLYALWKLVDVASNYSDLLASYLRSLLPVFLRRHISLAFLMGAFEWLIFALRWIVVPGLILPDFLQATGHGFRGFGKRGFSVWRNTVSNLWYWLVLVIAALLGVVATQKIMAMTGDFKHSTPTSETASLIFRLVISYILGLSAWMVTCSVVGRLGGRLVGPTQDVTRNPGS